MTHPDRSRRRGLNAAASILTLLTIGAAGFVWFGGYKLHVIESASMAPAVPTGALTLVKPVAIGDVRVGDAIAFVDPAQPGRTIMHRVTKRTKDDLGAPRLTTKGDANPEVDQFPVGGSELQGRVELVLPRAGVIGRVFTESWAPYAVGGVPTLFWLGNVVRDRRRRSRLGPVLASFAE